MAALRCDHCLLAFPERDAVCEGQGDSRKVFCCSGCRGIYLLIRDEGLAGFYQKRAWDESGIPSEAKERIDTRQFADRVRTVGGLQEITAFIEGIRCASCVWLNERILLKTAGVEYARINFATHTARIRWDPAAADLEIVLGRIHAIGYHPRPVADSELQAARRRESRDLLVRFGTAAFLSSQLMIYSIALYAGYFQGIDDQTRRVFEIIALLLTVPVLLYAGWPFLLGAAKGLRHGHFTMDSLIVAGSFSAFFYSVFEMARGGTVYFDTAAMIVTLILLGRYIESTAKGRASEAIGRLAQLFPKEARIVRELPAGEVAEMLPLSSVRTGDVLKVLPGERIPIDGVVVSGFSEVDESLITGESRPVSKSAGSPVIGGSINRFGLLVCRVTKTGDDTMLAGIIRAVEEAQEKRPKIQVLADRIVAFFVPAVIFASAATAAGYMLSGADLSAAVMTGVSVIVIACPCSLGLATPLAILVFTALASSRGVLVRSGDIVEQAARAREIILDKTGTLTTGSPELKKIIAADPPADPESLLRLAASIEQSSEHSIGRAIAAAAAGSLLPVEQFKAEPGRGVTATVGDQFVVIGNRNLLAENGVDADSVTAWAAEAAHCEENGETVVFMAVSAEPAAAFVVADRIRPEGNSSLTSLRELGMEAAIVSGDNRRTTAAVAHEAGIRSFLAEITPAGKGAYIRQKQERGNTVIMVGDGINDAPALSEASVGIAMGRGTDIAMESADVVLMRNDLALVPWFIALSRRTSRIIGQNIFWAFIYNVVAIPLAVAGKLHPIVAAGAMAASSLLVVLNSLRIRKRSNL